MDNKNRDDMATLAEPEQPYDQTALDLCKVCGWRTMIPGDACLNCERSKQPEKPVACSNTFSCRCPKHFNSPTPRKPPQFPTMLRKMWSGEQVQAWINDHWNQDDE